MPQDVHLAQLSSQVQRQLVHLVVTPLVWRAKFQFRDATSTRPCLWVTKRRCALSAAFFSACCTLGRYADSRLWTVFSLASQSASRDFFKMLVVRLLWCANDTTFSATDAESGTMYTRDRPSSTNTWNWWSSWMSYWSPAGSMAAVCPTWYSANIPSRPK